MECHYFSNEITKICTIVYQGLPLFKKSENDEYLQVNDTDPNFIYIFMNGYYKDIKEIGCYPKWFLGFYFKESQLETHKQFFDGFEGDDESLRVRRIAFRKSINEDEVFNNKQDSDKTTTADKLNHHHTRLLKIQEKVIEHFYGNQFDIDDPDTWTNQKVIVNWLITNFKLSAREAQSIDIVTRPDQARRK